MSQSLKDKLVRFIDSIATTLKMINIIKQASIKFAKKSTTARGKKSKKRKTHKRKQTGGGLLKILLRTLSVSALVYILSVLRDNADPHTMHQIDNFVKANSTAILAVGAIAAVKLIEYARPKHDEIKLPPTTSYKIPESYKFSDEYINNGKCNIKPFIETKPLEENEYYILCDKHQMAYLGIAISHDYFVDFSLVQITDITDNHEHFTGLIVVTYTILYTYRDGGNGTVNDVTGEVTYNATHNNTLLYDIGKSYEDSQGGKTYKSASFFVGLPPNNTYHNPIFLHAFPTAKFYSHINKVLTNVDKYTKEDLNLYDELDGTEEDWSKKDKEGKKDAIIEKFTIPPGNGTPEGMPVVEYFLPTDSLKYLF